MSDVELLDCTLRDGGYVNLWRFGHDNTVSIFERLVAAGVEIIEVGFLDDREPFDIDRTIFPDTASANAIYGGLDHARALVVAMIDIGTCDISNIQPAQDTCLDGIRVIFKKAKLSIAMDYCRQLKQLGYKVFANAVSITSYDDAEYHHLLDEINELEPFAFSIVDTYGLLHSQDVDYYFKTADDYLNEGIAIGYHAHNNFQLAYSNCIECIETPHQHNLVVDGSLHGIGKSAGNAATELLAMYLNDYKGKSYDIAQILEAIDSSILTIYQATPWGYRFKFYMAALNDCHPSYVTYLQDKKKLSIKSINEILSSLEGEKQLLYDEEYVERLYQEYQSCDCDDTAERAAFRELVAGREVLLLAPGNHIYDQKDRVDAYIKEHDPLVISVGFVPEGYGVPYVFLSNSKRYVQLATFLSRPENSIRVIATSNVTKPMGSFDYTFRYSDLTDDEALIVDNPLIMLLKLLDGAEVFHVALAGFDGYTTRPSSDYINPNMEYSFSKEKAEEITADTIASLKRLGVSCPITFVTDSLYAQGVNA